jgi:hypothetical protein
MDLFTSRGYETPTSKVSFSCCYSSHGKEIFYTHAPLFFHQIFMRTSVIVSDLLTYLPVAILFAKRYSMQNGWFQVEFMFRVA